MRWYKSNKNLATAGHSISGSDELMCRANQRCISTFCQNDSFSLSFRLVNFVYRHHFKQQIRVRFHQIQNLQKIKQKEKIILADAQRRSKRMYRRFSRPNKCSERAEIPSRHWRQQVLPHWMVSIATTYYPVLCYMLRKGLKPTISPHSCTTVFNEVERAVLLRTLAASRSFTELVIWWMALATSSDTNLDEPQKSTIMVNTLRPWNN